MDAYLVSDTGEENTKNDSSVDESSIHIATGEEVEGDDKTAEDTSALGFDIASIDDSADNSKYIVTIQRMAPIAGLRIDFDLDELDKSTNGASKPLLNLLVDSLAKVFKLNDSVRESKRRLETTEANVARLNHVRQQLEQDNMRLDKDVARMESTVQKEKLNFQRDTQQIRQELKETRVANTKMRSLKKEHLAKIRNLELQMGRLKDMLNRQMQQRDRKIKSGLAQTARLQAACFVKNKSGKGAVENMPVKRKASGPTKKPRKTTTGPKPDEIGELSSKGLREQNKRLASINDRFGRFVEKLSAAAGSDIAPSCFFEKTESDAVREFEQQLIAHIEEGKAEREGDAELPSRLENPETTPEVPSEASPDVQTKRIPQADTEQLASVQEELKVSLVFLQHVFLNIAVA